MNSGDRLGPSLDGTISKYEKMILILSRKSDSKWIVNELERALAKERDQSNLVLCPIRLDDAVLQSDAKWANEIRRLRQIADFSNWKDPGFYRKALDGLLRDLTIRYEGS